MEEGHLVLEIMEATTADDHQGVNDIQNVTSDATQKNDAAEARTLTVDCKVHPSIEGEPVESSSSRFLEVGKEQSRSSSGTDGWGSASIKVATNEDTTISSSDIPFTNVIEDTNYLDGEHCSREDSRFLASTTVSELSTGEHNKVINTLLDTGLYPKEEIEDCVSDVNSKVEDTSRYGPEYCSDEQLEIVENCMFADEQKITEGINHLDTSLSSKQLSTLDSCPFKDLNNKDHSSETKGWLASEHGPLEVNNPSCPESYLERFLTEGSIRKERFPPHKEEQEGSYSSALPLNPSHSSRDFTETCSDWWTGKEDIFENVLVSEDSVQCNTFSTYGQKEESFHRVPVTLPDAVSCPQRFWSNRNSECIIDLEPEHIEREVEPGEIGISAFQVFLASKEAITPEKCNDRPETTCNDPSSLESEVCRSSVEEKSVDQESAGNISNEVVTKRTHVSDCAVNVKSVSQEDRGRKQVECQDRDLIVLDEDWQEKVPACVISDHHSEPRRSIIDSTVDFDFSSSDNVLRDKKSLIPQPSSLASSSCDMTTTPSSIADTAVQLRATSPLLVAGDKMALSRHPPVSVANCLAISECTEQAMDCILEEAIECLMPVVCQGRADDICVTAAPNAVVTNIATTVHVSTCPRTEARTQSWLEVDTLTPQQTNHHEADSVVLPESEEHCRDTQWISEEQEVLHAKDLDEEFTPKFSEKPEDEDSCYSSGPPSTLRYSERTTVTDGDSLSPCDAVTDSTSSPCDSSPLVADADRLSSWSPEVFGAHSLREHPNDTTVTAGDLREGNTFRDLTSGCSDLKLREKAAGDASVVTVSPAVDTPHNTLTPPVLSQEMVNGNGGAERIPRPTHLDFRMDNEVMVQNREAPSTGGEEADSNLQRPQKVAALTEATLNDCYEPFDSVRAQLIRQSRDILLCRYHGDYKTFNESFLTPVATLLKKVRKVYQDTTRKEPPGTTSAPCHNCCALKWKGWPLCFNRRLVIHLAELDASLLKPGDFYLSIRVGPPSSKDPSLGPAHLGVTCRADDRSLRHHVIDESDYRALFTMDWSPDSEQDDHLTSRLQHLLVSVERGIERIEWETGVKPWTCGHVFPAASRCCHGNQVVDTKDCSVQTSPVEEFRDRMQECGVTAEGTCGVVEEEDVGQKVSPAASGVTDNSTGDPPHKDMCSVMIGTETPPACDVSRSSLESAAVSCREEDPDDGYYDHTLSQPTTISQADQDLLHSRIALLPGSRDVNGRSIVVVYCSQLEGNKSTLPACLAQMFMYFHTIPKKEVISQGFLVLADASGAIEENWSILDEALCLLEANIPNAISTVLLWSRESWDESTKLFTTSRVKYSVIYKEDRLHDFISTDQLLPDHGGTYVYDHQEWMSFRKFLEPFINGCRLSGRHLVTLLEELRGTRLPPSSSLTHQMIEQQKRRVNQTFHDEQLRHLEEEGETILKELESYRTRSPHNSDYRENLERTAVLYDELRRAMKKLSKLADKRLHKLEECLHMRTFEEESSQVLSWLCRKGEETLSKHQLMADTLGGIKEQEQEFEKFYFLAMRQIEKGNDLLEEAAMLGKDAPSTVSTVLNKADSPTMEGVQDLESSLREHLGSFNERLEDTRERLEDTAKCYNFLDKTYEWALQAMRFVSQMGLDSTGSPEGITKLIKTLQDYLDDHPPINEETFQETIELATKLGKERLIDQCKTARIRCQETIELIQTRQITLQKVKQQVDLGSLRHQWDAEDTQTPRKARSLSQPNNIWLPQNSSTPFQPIPGGGVHQRRSSISTTTPQIFGSPPQSSYTSFLSNYYPSSSMRENCFIENYLQEKEDHLLSHGLITEDLTSQGPVTSISWTPLESRLGQSGRDGQNTATNSIPGKCVSYGLKGNKTGAGNSSVQSSSQHKQIKKYVQRCLSWQSCEEALEKASADVREQNERLKTERLHSPPDESNESLNSISEGDDVENCPKMPVTHTRSDPIRGPVPVNTHLNRVSTLELADAVINEQSLNDEEAKAKKTLMLIMKEMIQTERDYVKSLEYIIENYLPELMRDDIPQALRGQRNVIFGNIEKIYEFHNHFFLNELEQCENAPFTVGQCFLHYEPQFYLYALYNKNKPKSDSLMSEYGNVFFRKKQLELGDKMDLASYLLKPVQRMGKYALLLKQLLKECPEREAEHHDLKAAEEMVRFQLRHGNDLLAMDALRDCDVNVKEQGRLLRQDEFLVWQGRSRKSLRHVFLFEDLVLFSKARRDPDRKGYEIYQYKYSFKTTDIGLTEQVGDSPTKFEIWFRKRKLNDVYVVQAPSPDVKAAWVQEISKLLWKQALRNREMRLAEMSSMGIGNKPCLDIKPSEDQISDRSISIHQLTRASRFRSSANSLQFDHLRNNKRPHSIISVSSSSSSGSSQSSFTFYGALNLGFEPGDSPRPLHRSLTQQSQCSTESGFCTDVSVAGDSPVDSEHLHKKAERSDSLLSNDSLSTSATTSDLTSSPGEDQTLEESIITSM